MNRERHPAGTEGGNPDLKGLKNGYARGARRNVDSPAHALPNFRYGCNWMTKSDVPELAKKGRVMPIGTVFAVATCVGIS